MPSSVFDVINAIASTLIIGLMLLAVYRGITIGRALINPVFRKRAFWTVTAAFFLFAALVSSILPLGPLGTTGLNLSYVVAPLFYLAFVTLFVLLDRSILTAMELDFFHRDTLRWKKVRRPLNLLWVVFIFYGTVIFNWYQSAIGDAPLVLQVVDIVAMVILFGGLAYSGLALVVSASRTADRTTRRFVRNLGLFVLAFVVGAVLGSPTNLLGVADELFLVLSFYFLYLAVMSLSPIGRITNQE